MMELGVQNYTPNNSETTKSKSKEENGHLNPTFDDKEEVYVVRSVVTEKTEHINALPRTLSVFTDPDLLKSHDTLDTPSSRRWLVLASAFISMVLASGFPYNLSVLYVEFLAEFRRLKAETALIQSVAIATFCGAGCITGIFVNKCGPRIVGIVAALLLSLAVGISYFATSVGYLIGTLGLVAGIGISGTFLGSMASITEHFDGKTKVRVASFLAFGTGLNTTIFPPIMNYLINTYGWRGCLLIMSGILLNLVPCFTVCKPRVYPKQFNNDHNREVSVENARRTFCIKLKNLLNNKMYVVFTFAISLSMSFLNGIMAIFVDFLMYRGFTRDEGVLLYFYMTLVGTCFRIVSGFCKSIPHFSIFLISIVHSAVGVVVCFALPGADTYGEFVALMCGFGFVHGGMISALYMTSVKILRPENYSLGFGIMITLGGLCSMAATPIIGFTGDISGSYDWGFYIAGMANAIGCLLYCITLILRQKQRGLQSENHQNDMTTNQRAAKRRSSLVPWKGMLDFVFL